MQGSRKMRRIALWLSLGSCALVASAGCDSTPKRKPTPEFLAVRPQRISVAEPYGGGDALEQHAGLEFRSQLARLGYDVVEPGAPADAELRYYLDRSEVGRRWHDGRESATVELAAELRSPIGILWEDEATAHGSGSDECDDRDDPLEVIVGMTADALEDSIAEPDYSQELDEAIHDAVHIVLLSLPKRPAPKPASDSR